MYIYIYKYIQDGTAKVKYDDGDTWTGSVGFTLIKVIIIIITIILIISITIILLIILIRVIIMIILIMSCS